MSRLTAEDKALRAEAYIVVGRALRSGELVRQSCQDCGDLKVQAHHANGYTPEHALDIMWLCSPCHSWRHSYGRRRPGVMPPHIAAAYHLLLAWQAAEIGVA